MMIFIVSLGSCRLCEPSVAPFLSIVFNGSKQYNNVISLSPKNILYQNSSQRSFSLPLWVGAEKMSFVFSSGTTSDTISVSYSRKFQLRSTQCGYEYEISGLKLATPNSFKNFTFDPFSFQIVIND